VGNCFRRADALIVDINPSSSTDTVPPPNSSSSNPTDMLLGPLFELNEALASQRKTMETDDSTQGPDLAWLDNLIIFFFLDYIPVELGGVL